MQIIEIELSKITPYEANAKNINTQPSWIMVFVNGKFLIELKKNKNLEIG